jgi:hypothetical protein
MHEIIHSCRITEASFAAEVIYRIQEARQAFDVTPARWLWTQET